MSNKPRGRQHTAVSFPSRATTFAAIGGAAAMILVIPCMSVCISAPPQHGHIPCGSRLELQMIGAEVRLRDRVDVSFQVAANGTTPISFTQSQVEVYLTWPSGRPSYVGKDLRFGKATPKIITIVPGGKPTVLTVSVLRGFGPPDEWTGIAPGKYSVDVWIRGNTKGQADFDYHWLGVERTKPYPIVVK
jgi:hypothetical protein